MVQFCDAFTGTVYHMGDRWLKAARETVASLLKAQIEKAHGDLEKNTRYVASFWREDYYSMVFPLRFCIQKEPLKFQKVFHDSTTEAIDLEASLEQGFRTGFLKGGPLPLILPAVEEGETGDLLADRLLLQAAMANLLLRQRSAPQEAVNAVRLAFLTYPLLEHLEASLPEEAVQIARFLEEEKDSPPYNLDPELLLLIRKGEFPDDISVGLAQVAVQRIKRYVFESPGLNEIRGASTLLDDLTEQAEELVFKELGPEVILRAVGSTIVFLAPDKDKAGELAERIQEGFYRATGAAFVAAAWREVRVKDLLENYQRVMEELQEALEADRARGEIPLTETLPFEARCRFCRTRPAEGWTDLPDELNAPVCRVCITKRRLGVQERSTKMEKILEWAGLGKEELPRIGVSHKDWFPTAIGRVTAEEGFIPDDARRALLATIYGDGNNFGAVGQKIKSIAMGLQWTQRVKWVTRAATAIALAQATKETADCRGKGPLPRLPFQVLALGGDDLSILAWAPVGVRFARHFLEMIDLEFGQCSGRPLADIGFSLGILVADAKAPVRRTVEFAEEQLLKWAKRAFRNNPGKKSNVAMLLALTPEQIPTDLRAYRENMYIRKGSWKDICLTLRPFTAGELESLLEKAEMLLKEGKGPFQRIVEAFVRFPPLVAMLFYLYQRGRIGRREAGEGKSWIEKLELLRGAPAGFPRFPAAEVERLPFGEREEKPGEATRKVLFSPLWDVLELIKILE